MLYGAAVVSFVLGCIVTPTFAGYDFIPVGHYSDDGRQVFSNEGRGEDVVQIAEGYNVGRDEKNKDHQDNGFYSAVLTDHTHRGDGEENAHHTYHGQKGNSAENLSNTGGHKKGYSTSGFQDFHHKDETGKKTTYYDSFDNSDGHRNYKSNEEVYGDKGSRGVQTNIHDGNYNQVARGSKGSFGHDDNVEHKSYKGNVYNRKGYVGGDHGTEYIYSKRNKDVRRPYFYHDVMKTYSGPSREFYSESYPQSVPFFAY